MIVSRLRFVLLPGDRSRSMNDRGFGGGRRWRLDLKSSLQQEQPFFNVTHANVIPKLRLPTSTKNKTWSGKKTIACVTKRIVSSSSNSMTPCTYAKWSKVKMSKSYKGHSLKWTLTQFVVTNTNTKLSNCWNSIFIFIFLLPSQQLPKACPKCPTQNGSTFEPFWWWC